MAPKSKRQLNGFANYYAQSEKRAAENVTIETSAEKRQNRLKSTNNNDLMNNITSNVPINDLNDSFTSLTLQGSSISCQTDFVNFKDAETQTINSSNNLSKSILTEFHVSIDFQTVLDLINIMIDLVPNYNAIHRRLISLIIYFILRLTNCTYEICESILIQLNLMSIRSCTTWVHISVDEGDICVVLRDKRGSYKRIDFYDLFPELEKEAKTFALEGASSKHSGFDVKKLSEFVNKRFRELYEQSFEKTFEYGDLVRSQESCRVDLLKWGAKWDKNANRPYFEGHEREDVVKSRVEFVNYFSKNKDLYYYPKHDENNNLVWNKPTRKMRILLSHDESTFKSGINS